MTNDAKTRNSHAAQGLDDEALRPNRDGYAFQGLHHVTVHAVGDERVLRDGTDKRELLSRFRNYLDPDPIRDSARHLYKKLGDEISLVTFGLLDNHYHLILQELMQGALTDLMRRAHIGYARYFNDRYRRRGPLFDRSFMPTPIVDSDHAKRAIAYVHLNHVVEQLDYPYTGHRQFLGFDRAGWIRTESGLELFGSTAEYKRYLNVHGPAIIDRKLQKYRMCRETYKYRPID